MPAIVKLRFLLGLLGILAVATWGCQPASRTESTQGSANAAKPGSAGGTATVPANGGNVTSPATPGGVQAEGGPKSLGVGDPAPPLTIARWVTGEPIAGLEPGQVYVIEFWATWCPPCRTSMPHLSQLQQQYGDKVLFVGITGETEDTVRSFLAEEQSPGKKWAEVVKYRLAIDAQEATEAAYMQAAGQEGIPTAFVVGRDGVVEWIGHPMSLDEPLGQIVAGTWDRKAAMSQFQQQKKLQETQEELNELLGKEAWDQALALLDRLEKDGHWSAQLSTLKLTLLQKAGRTQEAAKLRAELVEKSWDDARVLNDVAWGIATGSGERDLALALKAAQRASELREHKDAAILDTLARVYYEQGQLDKAIEWQKKASEHNNGEPSIDATLKKYEAEKAPKSPAASPQTKTDAGAAKGSP